MAQAALPRTIPLPKAVKQQKDHGFHFGGDPEFCAVDVIGGNEQILTTWGGVNTVEMNFGGDRVGKIGSDYDTCFEIRSNFGTRWVEDWYGVCQILLRNLARRRGFQQQGYVLLENYPHQRDGSSWQNVSSSSNGGHIHLSSEDPDWYYSFQAMVTLPWWLQFAATITDKKQLERIRRGGYGAWAEMDPSPNGTYTETVSVNVDGHTVPRWWNNWYDSISEKQQHSTKGWEYRGLQQQIGFGPSNKRFREIQAGIFYNILLCSKRQQTQQERFMKELFRIRGIDWNSDEYFYSSYSSNLTIKRAMEKAKIGEFGRSSQLPFKTITDPPTVSSVAIKLKKLMEDIQEAHEVVQMPQMDWFIKALKPTDVWSLDALNQVSRLDYDRHMTIEPLAMMPVTAGKGTRRKVKKPSRATWSPKSIWNSVLSAWNVMTKEMTSWWYRRGIQLIQQIPIKYPLSNPSASLGQAKDCRDEGLFHMLAISSALAYYAINDIIPDAKWSRTVYRPVEFIGCKDSHGSEDEVFFYNTDYRPPEANSIPFHEMGGGFFTNEIQEDGLKIGTLQELGITNIGDFWIGLAMRQDSEYDLPHLIVASYILYRLGYMSDEGIMVPVEHFDQYMGGED